MKLLPALFSLVFVSTAAFAQQPGMTPEMQKMMENMQKNMGQIQKCMAQVDQKAMENMQVKAKKMEAEVKRLCAAGQRDEAQTTAMKFGIELSKDPELQKMRKCTEGMQGMQGMPVPGEFFPKGGKDDKPKHICDA